MFKIFERSAISIGDIDNDYRQHENCNPENSQHTKCLLADVHSFARTRSSNGNAHTHRRNVLYFSALLWFPVNCSKSFKTNFDIYVRVCACLFCFMVVHKSSLSFVYMVLGCCFFHRRKPFHDVCVRIFFRIYFSLSAVLRFIFTFFFLYFVVLIFTHAQKYTSN